MEERFKKDVENFQNAESRIMGDFKGTKGEWFVNPYDVILRCVISTEKSARGHETICYMNGKSDYDDECNAQLIAAAPDLLDALIEIDKDLCVLEGSMAHFEKSDPRADGMTTLVSEWRERNKKAINKALGK